MAERRPLVAIAGSVAQNIRYGGHVWVFLHYLLGFRRLGYDVLLIDGGPAGSPELRRLADTLARFGLSDSYTVLGDDGAARAGVARRDVLGRVARADFLLNVTGILSDEQIL